MAALSYTTSALIKAQVPITDTTDDTFIATVVLRTNEWLENKIGHPVGPDPTTLYLFDGFDAIRGMRMMIERGVQSISLLRIAQRTGATLVTVPSTDYYIRPSIARRRPGEPGFYIQLTNVPSTSNPATFFYEGFENVEVTGVFGYAAIPNELESIATRLGATAWRGRSASSSGDQFTIGIDGSRTFENMLSAEDRRTIARYRSDPIAVG